METRGRYQPDQPVRLCRPGNRAAAQFAGLHGQGALHRGADKIGVESGQEDESRRGDFGFLWLRSSLQSAGMVCGLPELPFRLTGSSTANQKAGCAMRRMKAISVNPNAVCA